LILEKNRETLQKVKVSGGGRCNVTNSCFDPEQLVKNYPRGEEFLLNPFKNFGPAEMVQWLENRGVRVKTEPDGRIFPVSNNSQTIIDCFRRAAQSNGVSIRTSSRAINFEARQDGWEIELAEGPALTSKFLLLSTGSDKMIWEKLKAMNLQIIEPVPSLFTFHIDDKELQSLSGVSFEKVKVTALGMEMNGPALITHWGLSGPAVLKLSAFGALDFALKSYRFKIRVDFLPLLKKDQILETFRHFQQNDLKRKVVNTVPFELSRRFWEYICQKAGVREFQNWSETGKKHFAQLTELLKNASFEVTGKSTFKEEFVTAGGIDLSEVDSGTFQITKYPGLFAAGEVLNIDAVTGGFNFQAAWTAGWHVADFLRKSNVP
jgi:predicted Rossmann fold flavoprotein